MIPLSAVHPALLALAGGRGPAGWGLELSQRNANLRVLERASAWIEPLIAAHPRLRDGPLMGSCLDTLLERTQGSSELVLTPHPPPSPRFIRSRGVLEPQQGIRRRKTARRRSDFQPGWGEEKRAAQIPNLEVARRPSVSLGDTVTVNSQACSSLPGEEPGRRPLPAPLQLEPRASRALLEFLGGHTVTVLPGLGTEQSDATMRSIGTWRPTRKWGQPHGEATRWQLDESAVATQGLEPQRGWLESLAWRAECSLRRYAPDALAGGSRSWSASGALTPSSTQAEGLDGQPSNRGLTQAGIVSGPDAGGAALVTLPRDGPALAEGWRLALDGQIAPLDLLVRLTNSSAGDSGSGSGEDLARQVSSPQSGPPRGQAVRPEWRSQPGQAPVTGLEGADTSTQEDSRHPSEAYPAATNAMPKAGLESWVSTRIAPPSAASGLPPLLPSQEVGVPSPPVASAAIQRGTELEETARAEDDLSTLAARIKRILIEESRRYGMDVS